jgi:hypothetical protein
MPVVRRVALGGLSGPVLTRPEQRATPRLMPTFDDVFRRAPTIQLPRGLK